MDSFIADPNMEKRDFQWGHALGDVKSNSGGGENFAMAISSFKHLWHHALYKQEQAERALFL